MNIFTGKINDFISWLQFRVDTTEVIFDSPKFDYQPIPWLGIKSASVRGKATIQRWNLMKKNMPARAKSLKDIGSNVGYFCLMASDQLGMYAVGIDVDVRFLRLSELAKQRGKIERATFMNLYINKDSVNLLPQTDVTLVLSIWHHWVYEYGLPTATKILQDIWDRTNMVMFFESGEEETASEFKLPFSTKESAKETLSKYLADKLKGSNVSIIGETEAGHYEHYDIKSHKRSLFKVVKK